jgi:outer membrane protein OmpA-like peptidoglycan-associated protein
MTNTQFRRAAGLALLACVLALPAHAQSEEATIPKAAIVESLSKDVVIDSAGRAMQPAVDLWVQFAFNSAQLTPLGRRQLDELGMALNDKALVTWGFQLAGHTDAVGSAAYNLRLSLERANAVKAYLMTQHGINPGRLVTQGYGYTRLADPANPKAAINRRVEVGRVLMQDGAAVAPAPAVVSTPAPAPAAPAGGRLVPTP